MKKILYVIACVILVAAVIAPCVAFAEEVVTETSAEETTYHDIFTRVYDFVVTNKTECLSAAGSLMLLVYNLAANFAKKKRDEETDRTLTDIGNNAITAVKSQSSIIDVVNVMSAGYNQMRESYEKVEGTETDRNRIIGSCLITNVAILEILSKVYVHSGVLPQGVKDFVELQHTNCLKSLQDDELVSSVVETVRNKINEETKDESAN